MSETIPDKTHPSGSEAKNATGRFIKSADSFFHRPDGVFWICLFLFGLTVWTFAPALQTDFQYFDDATELQSNAHVNTGLNWQNLRWALFSFDYSTWFPLTWISHMLDFEMFGSVAWGHHLINVLFHAANCVLLFLVLNRMTGVLWRSLIVAMLFALHPLRVESVAWISDRKDLLAFFWGLLTLWAYARYAQEQGARSKVPIVRSRNPFSTLLSPCFRFYFLALFFFALSLMSKSMLVTLPCVLLLLDYWPLNRISDFRFPISDLKRLLLEKIPFFLLVVPVSLAAYVSQKAGGAIFPNLPLGLRAETALMNYARYLGKMFWPADFSVLYPYPDHWPASQLLCAAALIFGISIAAFMLRRQRPYLLVGWLWYLGTLVPVIGLIPLYDQSMCNRFTYIPMVGVLVLLVWAIDDLTKPWRRRTMLAAMVTVFVMGASIFRTRGEIAYWKNSETLWNRTIAVTKDNFVAHSCLGVILLKTNPDKALVEFQKSIAIHPDYAESQRGLAFLLEDDGRCSDAIVHFEKAIQLEPQNGWARQGLGMALFKLNRVGDAIPHLLKAVELEPQVASFKDDLGQALFSSGHEADAISNFLASAQADSAGFGRFLDSMQSDTNHAVLINSLAWSFATNPDPGLRNSNYAIRLATRACEMSGYQTTAYVGTLAAAFGEDSQFDKAVSTTQLACSLASAAGQTALLKKDQALLELFRSHQAYHESAPAMSP